MGARRFASRTETELNRKVMGKIADILSLTNEETLMAKIERSHERN